jgi:gas vesicle protein
METKKTNFGLGMLLGTVIGGLAALLLSPGSGKQNREKFKKSIKNILKYLEKQELDKKLEALVKDSSTLASKYFSDIKEELTKDLQEIKGSVDKIDLELYSKKVDDLIEIAKKKYQKVPSSLNDIRNHFLSMFDERGEDVMEKIEEEVAESLKKPTKKTKLSA